MIIKTESSKAIMDFLKEDLIINLNIIGIIENVPKVEIYVDDIKNPKGVFVKKDYFHYIYSKEDSFIDEATDTFFKDGFFGLSGVEESIANKIKKKFEVAWDNPCDLYYIPKENLKLNEIKNQVQSVELKDAEVVNEFYEFRHPESLEAIKDDIQRRPSSAVYVNGEIACWVLVHDDNSMGIMYTREEHRRNGYAVDVTIDLASKILNSGKIPYLQIIERNSMSPGLANKCGFIKVGRSVWFGIIAGTPKEFIEANNESRKQFIESLSGIPCLTNTSYVPMYSLLYKLNENYKEVSNFSFCEVKDDNMFNIWCDTVCKGYEMSKNEKIGFKKIILDSEISKKTEYKFYVGNLDGKAVATSVLLKSNEEDSGIYFISTIPEFRNKGIGTAMVIETLKTAKAEGSEFISMQTPEKYRELFEKVGFQRLD